MGKNSSSHSATESVNAVGSIGSAESEPRARSRRRAIAKCWRTTANLEREFPGRYVIFGHIGDAHVHVNIFSDPANPARASDLLRDFARQAVALGGTVSAEHGLGKRKRHLLELQYSADIEKMRAVKRRLDPANILGRGTPL